VTVYLIEKGTPSAVKINIFKRINTGGLPLSPQEIRHALNGPPVTDLLRTLAASFEFQRVTRGKIPSDRMVDREYVVRFFSFLLTTPEDYKVPEFDSFLNDTMSRVNKLSVAERAHLEERFRRSMRVCYDILGKYAFRKRYEERDWLKPINKALFDTWSVNLEALDDAELAILKDRSKLMWEKYMALMHNRAFEQSVTQGTGDIQRVRLRFRAIRELLKEVIS
jgi:hypothetical protein